jgi:hypothetical protein
MATNGPGPQPTRFLNATACPSAEISDEDRVMPRGFLAPEETVLGRTAGFLTDEQQKQIVQWWLKKPSHKLPNWDIASTCRIDGQQGLLLVEAKAHAGEMGENDCCGAGEENYTSISGAVAEVSDALNKANGGGWHLNVTTRYQLCNRFAWAWKVASFGVPVVLVYLGFLNTLEWDDRFTSHADWERCLLNHADGCVPRSAWGNRILVNGVPVVPLIRSADVNIVRPQA